MADGEVPLDFVARVRAGLVDGWRWERTASGEHLVDTTQRQVWLLRRDEPASDGWVVATEHPPAG